MMAWAILGVTVFLGLFYMHSRNMLQNYVYFSPVNLSFITEGSQPRS